jgi:hypothetical protein
MLIKKRAWLVSQMNEAGMVFVEHDCPASEHFEQWQLRPQRPSLPLGSFSTIPTNILPDSVLGHTVEEIRYTDLLFLRYNSEPGRSDALEDDPRQEWRGVVTDCLTGPEIDW